MGESTSLRWDRKDHSKHLRYGGDLVDAWISTKWLGETTPETVFVRLESNDPRIRSGEALFRLRIVDRNISKPEYRSYDVDSAGEPVINSAYVHTAITTVDPTYDLLFFVRRS